MKLETAIETLKELVNSSDLKKHPNDKIFYRDCIKTIEENVEEMFGK